MKQKFISALFMVALGSGAVFADQKVKNIDIEAQGLESALMEFSRQTGIQVLFSQAMVNSYNVAAVSGSEKPDAVLRKYLQGTGLDFKYSGLNTVVIINDSQSSSASDKTLEKNGKESMILEEMVITAQKRSQSINDVAMSISAISGEDIEKKSLVSMQDYLSAVPGVTFADFGPGQNHISIRGIGLSITEQATVSAYFGEIPLTPPIGGGGFSQLGGSSTDMTLVDIERVEVLKGPQGTLYGSGAMGGVVRNIPVAPELNKWEGKFDAGYGLTTHSNDGNNKLTGALNIPLIDDSVAVRVVGYRFDNAGYVDMINTPEIETIADAIGLSVNQQEDVGANTYTGGRASLLWQASENMNVTVVLASQKLEQEGTARINTGYGGYKYASLSGPGFRDFNKEEFDISNLVIEYDLDWATVLGSFSHFTGNSRRQATIVSPPFAGTLVSFQSEKTGDTLEVRLASQLDGPLQFVVGLYNEDFELGSNQMAEWPSTLVGSPIPLVPDVGPGPNGFPVSYVYPTHMEQTLDHKAIFGELTYEFSPHWSLSGGMRWFDYERRDDNQGSYFFGPINASDTTTSERDKNFKMNLSYTPNDDSLIYLQWAEGFRIGNGQSLPPSSVCDIDNDGKLDFTNAELDPIVESDATTNYELGAKFTLLDSKLALSAAIYRIDWDRIPIRFIDTSDVCPGNLGVTDNAGEARSEGIEFNTQYYVTPDFQLFLSTSYMKTQYLTDDAGEKGSRLPLSPRVNGSVGMEYHFDFSGYPVYLRSDYIYTGGFVTDASFALPAAESYGKWNMRAGFDVDQWSFSVYGNNLTNEDAIIIGSGIAEGYRLMPRVVGFDVGYTF